MNIKLFFFSLLAVSTLGMQAALPEEAERLYLHGEYAAALSLYRQIEAPSRSMYYAMGACCYHLGDDAQALAYWKRAEKGASLRMYAGIDTAKEKIYQKHGKEYQVSWKQRAKRVWRMIPVLFLQLLIIIVLAIQFLLSSSWKLKVLLRVILIFSFISIYQIVDDSRYGVVRRAATVYTGPDSGYSTIAQLNSMDEVTVEDQSDTWYKIRHSKIKGWVGGEDIALV